MPPSPLIRKVLYSSDGNEVYSEGVGNTDKPHLVFVHGFTLCGSVYDKIFHDAKYQEEFYLVRYDMRGHGRSGKPDDLDRYESKLYADDFKAVAEAYNLSNPIYVGWSLGGTPAADIVAHLPPKTLSGIVYLGSMFSTEYIGELVTPLGLEKVAALVSPESDSGVIRWNMVTFYDAFFDLLSDDLDPIAYQSRRLDRWDIQSTWLGYAWNQTTSNRRNVIARKQDPEPLFTLGKEGFPVLIVHGKEDKLVSCEKMVEESKKRFTNLDIAIMTDGGNHAPFYEDPGEVMRHIDSFAKKIRGAAGTTT